MKSSSGKRAIVPSGMLTKSSATISEHGVPSIDLQGGVIIRNSLGHPEAASRHRQDKVSVFVEQRVASRGDDRRPVFFVAGPK